MVVKLYTLFPSPPCRAVMMVAEAINLPLELEKVDLLNGGTRTPEFLEKNPQHTVPVLDDNGFVFWDSHAICTYLITKYAKDDSLYPKDFQQRAIIDQRLHFDSGILFPRLRNAVGGLIYKGETSIPEEKLQDIVEAYDFVEKFLSLSKWIAGDKFTIADICCVATVSSLHFLKEIDAKKYPLITQWIKKCEQLEIYKKWNASGLIDFANIVNSRLQK